MVTYSAITRDITVRVSPVYIDGQSDVIERRFVFGYFVRIENDGRESVRLRSRRWLIRDSNNRLEEVTGDGVVGEQPLIGPGKAHEYNSYCILETFEGTMEGSYTMERENGNTFEVDIPRFFLRANVN